MRNVGKIEPLHPIVERLLQANVRGDLNEGLLKTLGEALDKAGLKEAGGRPIDCVMVLGERKVDLLHPPADKAAEETDPDHLEKRHQKNGCHATEVVPMTYMGLSNSGCVFINGKWVCW